MTPGPKNLNFLTRRFSGRFNKTRATPGHVQLVYYIFVNVCMYGMVYVCKDVCIDTMGASTAGGIPAKLRGDIP